MLPRTARMRSPQDFRHVVRRGVRTGRPTLVVHAAQTGAVGVQVGFVVAKAVGNAVTRNRVRRRLRHLVRPHLPTTPVGTAVVVRALPAAASSPADLQGDLEVAWDKTVKRLELRSPGPNRSATP